MRFLGKIVLLSFALCLTSCNLLDSESRNLMGHYVSEDNTHIDDDIPCDVHLLLNEELGALSFKNNVELNVTFYLEDAFDFPDMTLNFDVFVDGSWSYSDSILTVTVDTTSFNCNYIGSSAKSATEESMVRQIRKNVVAGELMPRLRKQIIESSERKVKVCSVSEEGIILEHPISKDKHQMKRIND